MFSDLHERAVKFGERLPEMEARFESLASRYEKLRKIAETHVTTWEWTALPRYELQPFFFELGDARRGRLMRGQPEKIAGRHQYGFATDKRLLLERQHTEFPGQFYEKFFAYNEREIAQDLFSYDVEKSPINSTRMFRECDRYLCFQRWAIGGNSQVVYELSLGRIIAQLAIYRRFGKGDSIGGIHTMEYLADDTIRIWGVSGSGRRTLAYEGAMAVNPSVDERARSLLP